MTSTKQRTEESSEHWRATSTTKRFVDFVDESYCIVQQFAIVKFNNWLKLKCVHIVCLVDDGKRLIVDLCTLFRFNFSLNEKYRT